MVVVNSGLTVVCVRNENKLDGLILWQYLLRKIIMLVSKVAKLYPQDITSFSKVQSQYQSQAANSKAEKMICFF